MPKPPTRQTPAPRYRVLNTNDHKYQGWTLQRFALSGPSGYLGELVASQVTANKIERALKRSAAQRLSLERETMKAKAVFTRQDMSRALTAAIDAAPAIVARTGKRQLSVELTESDAAQLERLRVYWSARSWGAVVRRLIQESK